MPDESSDTVKISYPQFSREELISVLDEGATRLSEKLPLVCVVLYGSYAKNRQTAASDVDLLVVYLDPKKEDDYSIVWDTFGIAILEPHIYTASQYANLIRQKAWLPSDVQQSGILIFGNLPSD